jgi:uncharacterized protein (DUF952 family)
MSTIYKIIAASHWRAAEHDGIFRGSADDLRDGFIHFSTAEQIEETAAKHFAGQDDLLLLSVDGDKLGAALRWEASRGGALFPHLHGELALAAVIKVEPLPLNADDRHALPRLTP